MNYSINEQVSYLDGVFERLWRAGEGLIRDRAIHEIGESLPSVVKPIHDSFTNFSELPGMSQSGGNIKLRIPGVGNHLLFLWLGLDIKAAAHFHIDLLLHPTAPPARAPWVNTGVDLPWYWDLITAGLGTISFGGVGVAAATIPTIIQEIIEEVVNKNLGGEGGQLATQLKTLSTLTFDYNAPYLPNNVQLEPITAPALGDNLAGNPLDWIDIVLVADNYNSGDLGSLPNPSPYSFLSQTAVIEDVILKHTRLDNVRFRAMGTVIRFWRFPVNGTTDSELIAKASGDISTFGNLSRLAETGLRIQDALETSRSGQPLQTNPIIVILKRVKNKPPNPRAIALGDVTIVPIWESETGEAAATVLLHELGHVIGGLADEYDDNSVENYLGPEPEAINVTKNPHLSQKWNSWHNKLPRATPDIAYRVEYTNVGAYEFADVFRPASICKMSISGADRAFCPVCEETIALRLLERFGLNNPHIKAPLTVEVEYLSPWQSAPRRFTVEAPLLAGGSPVTIELEAAKVFLGESVNTTHVKLTVIRTAVPDGRQTLQRLPNPKGSTDYLIVDQTSVAQLEVTPDPLSPLPQGVRDSLRQSVTLTFNKEPNIQLTPPTDLQQDPPVGSVIRAVVNPMGTIKKEGSIGAHSGAGENLNQDTTTVFLLYRESDPPIEIHRIVVAGQITDHTIQLSRVPLPFGKYRWEALSRIKGADIESERSELPAIGDGFHFEIQLEVEPYDALPKPFGPSLSLLEWKSSSESQLVTGLPGLDVPEADVLDPDVTGLPVPDVWGMPPVEPIIPGGPPPIGGPPIERPPIETRGALEVVPENSTFCSASAYHPEGKPIIFQFEVRNVDESFTEKGIIFIGYKEPAKPYESLQVTGGVSLDDPRVPSNIPTTGLDVKFRVRTSDKYGLVSPWIEYIPSKRPLPVLRYLPIGRIRGRRPIDHRRS